MPLPMPTDGGNLPFQDFQPPLILILRYLPVKSTTGSRLGCISHHTLRSWVAPDSPALGRAALHLNRL